MFEDDVNTIARDYNCTIEQAQTLLLIIHELSLIDGQLGVLAWQEFFQLNAMGYTAVQFTADIRARIDRYGKAFY